MHLDAYILLGLFLFITLLIVTNTDITGHEPSSKVVIRSENGGIFDEKQFFELSSLNYIPEVQNTTANHKTQWH